MTPTDTHGPPPPSSFARWLDRNLTVPMLGLSIIYLAVASGVIHRLAHQYVAFFEVHLLAWGLIVLWPIFAAEALVRFIVTRTQMSFWPRLWILIGVILFPFIRMALRSYTDPGKIWLPGLGWQAVDRTLRRTLERFFGGPMIVIALMVLPVLGLEYFWEEEVRSHFWLSLGLDIASSIIWMAFAIEFTVSMSVAERKLAYCVQNWMDLAVVVLPVVDFLPILRLWQLGRLLQLNQVGRMARLYRLRGLMLKAWRAILILEMISRLLGNYRERRLRNLKDQITAKEIELEELRQEVASLERQLREETAKSEPPPRVEERETAER